MVKVYCLNCKKRHLGCHSDCEDYKKYKEELEHIKKNIKIEKQLYNKSKWRRCLNK